MARKPSNFITVVKGEFMLFGGQVFQRAEEPPYLSGEWNAEHVTLYRQEEYAGKHQGVYKIARAGGGAGQARIKAKALIEGAGLIDGRYVPSYVGADRIEFPTLPHQLPEAYQRRRISEGDVSV